MAWRWSVAAVHGGDAFGGLGKHEHTILVLQGGGALGAYQAGVYEGLAEAGCAPGWIAGVSIGAINAALIAGNRPEQRLERLREFWNRVSSGIPGILPAYFDPLRLVFNRFSALATATFGAPGFFKPRFPPPFLARDGTPQALSLYDTTPLRETLRELVNFDLINERTARLSLGAVNIRTGNCAYFDNYSEDPRIEIGPEHVMASGALPPGFPPLTIDGEAYWDGGIVSNTPLWYVLDDSRQLNALIFQVDLFSATGGLPRNLAQVLEREKDIQYSSKTRFNTKHFRESAEFNQLLRRLLHELPAKFQHDPDYVRLRELARPANIAIVHMINRRTPASSDVKDYEFSRATVTDLWAAGLNDVRRSVAHPDWRQAMEQEPGVRVFDLTR